MALLREFKKFLLKGNVVDLAVAFVMSQAFQALVTSFVRDMVTPLITAVSGNESFGGLVFTVNGSRFLYGAFLNEAFTFVMTGMVVFYMIVLPMNTFSDRKIRAGGDFECPFCLSEIPARARKCKFCGTALLGFDVESQQSEGAKPDLRNLAAQSRRNVLEGAAAGARVARGAADAVSKRLRNLRDMVGKKGGTTHGARTQESEDDSPASSDPSTVDGGTAMDELENGQHNLEEPLLRAERDS